MFVPTNHQKKLISKYTQNKINGYNIQHTETEEIIKTKLTPKRGLPRSRIC